MSLNWDARKIAGYEELVETEAGQTWMRTMIHATMIVDIGDITEDNVEEFVVRWRMFDDFDGNPYCHTVDENGGLVRYVPTVEDVRKYVGLHTNVPTKTMAQFKSKLRSIAKNKIETIESIVRAEVREQRVKAKAKAGATA